MVLILSTSQRKHPTREGCGRPGVLLSCGAQGTSKPCDSQCLGGSLCWTEVRPRKMGKCRDQGRGTSVWMLGRLDQSRPCFQPAGIGRADTCLCASPAKENPALCILCWGWTRFVGCGSIQLLETAAPGESVLPASLVADRWVGVCTRRGQSLWSSPPVVCPHPLSIRSEKGGLACGSIY